MREQNKRDQERPYLILGIRLRRLREQKQETLAEVSGAVEIDMHELSKIERGASRPSEDILMLLMNHFALQDEEAVKLWNLAGYDYNLQNTSSQTESSVKQVMVLPMDARVVYTDMVHVMVNKRGVVMNFMQEAGLGGQPLAVARVGMSREHAQSVVELLQKALSDQDVKLLPAPKPKDSGDTQKKS